MEDFILQKQIKTITIDIYDDEDTLISNDAFDLISQHSHDNFHLIPHAEIDTSINNFRDA
jgi:hypothetical protein